MLGILRKAIDLTSNGMHAGLTLTLDGSRSYKMKCIFCEDEVYSPAGTEELAVGHLEQVGCMRQFQGKQVHWICYDCAKE